MIETVIFDLDGVIIDSEPFHFLVEKKLFKEYGADITEQEHLSFVGTSSINMWTVIKSKFNINFTSEQLVEINEDRYLQYLNNVKDIEPISGVKEFIIDLHRNNFQLIIASSSSRKIINTVLQKFELSKYFSFIVSGAELINSKPDPEIFNFASKKGNTKPENCLVIEDSENGIKAAKAAHMNCVAFKNPNSGNQVLSLADFIIDDFNLIKIDTMISKLNNR